jgi:hypothetical protein
MTIGQRIVAGLTRNPLAWLLLGAFLIASFKYFERDKQLERVCELTGPHDVMTSHPRNGRDEVDNICGPLQGR